jgi:hypothetical protein
MKNLLPNSKAMTFYLYPLLNTNTIFSKMTCYYYEQLNFQKELKNHMETFDENHARDFMDVYIAEMKKDRTGFFTCNNWPQNKLFCVYEMTQFSFKKLINSRLYAWTFLTLELKRLLVL